MRAFLREYENENNFDLSYLSFIFFYFFKNRTKFQVSQMAKVVAIFLQARNLIPAEIIVTFTYIGKFLFLSKALCGKLFYEFKNL